MRLRWMLLVGWLTVGWLVAVQSRAQVANQPKPTQQASKDPPQQSSKAKDSKAPAGAAATAASKGEAEPSAPAGDVRKEGEGEPAPKPSGTSKEAPSQPGGSASQPSRGGESKPSGGSTGAPGSGAKSGGVAAGGAPPGVPVGGEAPGGAAGGEAAGGSAAPLDGGTFVVRLRDLEQRIDELKEQIRRSHTRLSLLSDTILASGVGGARAQITVINDLSDVFRLDKLLVVLDGAVQYNKTDDGNGLSEQGQIPIFSGSIPPGDHTVQVLVKLRGHGYGVFSYLRGYHFEIKDSHSFTVTEGKTANLEVIVFEEGGMTTQVEERPRIRYAERIEATAREGRKSRRGAVPSPKPRKQTQSKQSGAK